MTIDQPPPSEDATRTVAAILRKTRPWAMFFSILGFVSSGVMVFVGLIAGTIGIAMGSVETALLVIFYPLFGVLYIFPSIYLFRYASRIRQFVDSGQEQDLASALDAQRSFWKFIGILTVVSLVIAVIGIAAAIAIGVAARILTAQ